MDLPTKNEVTPMIISYFNCICGALTVRTDDGKNYSVKKSRKKIFFPDLDLRKIEKDQTVYNCNHCVNHYGLDLCGCGSGKPFGRCDNNFEECQMPMQLYGKYSFVRAKDALI